MEITAKDLLEAADRIAPFVHNTPVQTSMTFNQMTGAEVHFKCENYQKMGAFKMRGAVNATLMLTDEQRAKGIATHSSGNFAQAVALTAKLMGIKAWVVMPENAPEIKKTAVREYGATIVECPSTLKDREETLAKVVAETGATFLHAYNDYHTIIGQSTSAQELLISNPNLDYILTPVGGGGLVSGTALAAHYFGKNTTVIGAEPEGANDAFLSLQAGKIIPQLNPQTICDGLRTSLGDKGFPIMQKYLDRIITVSEEEIVAAMRIVWERMKMIIEPSSAVPVAAVLKNKAFFANKKVGIIISGGNVDLGKLPF